MENAYEIKNERLPQYKVYSGVAQKLLPTDYVLGGRKFSFDRESKVLENERGRAIFERCLQNGNFDDESMEELLSTSSKEWNVQDVDEVINVIWRSQAVFAREFQRENGLDIILDEEIDRLQKELAAQTSK